MAKKSSFRIPLDKWDSHFFKTPIARFTISEEKELTRFLIGMPDLIAQAKREKIRHIFIKLEGHTTLYEKKLLRFGMKKCGESVDSRFSYDGKKREDVFLKNGIDVFRPTDIKEIKDIAKNAFRKSYFYECGFAGKSIIDRYHAVWIENLSMERDSHIFVSRKSGVITGFFGLKLDRGARLGRIVLIAVHKQYRGMGIGNALICKCISWCNDKVSAIFVKTQKSNRPALALYKKNGFKIVGCEKIFYKKI